MAVYEVNQKMTNLANAIREKTGTTAKLSLDDMITAVSALSLTEEIAHANIPDYVKAEALRVANEVKSVLRDESIVFLTMSDTHQYGAQADSDTYTDADGVQTNTSNLHSAMAAKILSYILDFDFMAHLGDSTWGSAKTTSELLQSQASDTFSLLKESHEGIPCFHAIGNHDTGIYYHNQMISDGNSGTYTETGDYLYGQYTALSESEDTVVGGVENGGYCYRDFSDKKLRVFLLNTSESLVVNQTDKGTLGSQRIWLANALLDLNSKTDASEWGFIVLSHYPADYGNTMPLSELFKAYVEGSSITISSEDEISHIIDFASANMAKFIAQFHGHVHNFKTDKLSVYENSSSVSYDAWRICVPNGQYNRENYYSTVGSYTDIDFQEKDSNGEKLDYLKTVGSAKDTSFVINVINPSEEIIYSFCYGAGRDRTIGYGDTVYYSITNALSNLTISNEAGSAEEGKSFTATLIPSEHCIITSVFVTMGGEDITSSVYSDGIITIGSVIGDVVITASAEIALACTNQIPISTDTSGNVYNGTGYKAKTYINGGVESTNAAVCTTGFIPVKNGDIIRMQDMSFSTNDGNHRIVFYDSEKNYIAFIQANSAWYLGQMNATVDNAGNCTDFTVNTSISATVSGASVSLENTAFIRVCCANITDNSILTVNEEIKYADEVEDVWSVVNNLTYATNDNSATTISNGERYTANITASSGYVLESVVVTMGGVNISDTVYSDGIISIDKVTGNIIITVVATSSGANVVLTSEDENGNIFNGTGYKNEYRLNSSGQVTTSSIASAAVGFIEFEYGQKLEVTGGSWNNSASYVCVYDASHSLIQAINYSNLLKEGYGGPAYSTTDDTYLYWDSSTCSNAPVSGSWSDMHYIRFSCGVDDGANLFARVID